MTIRGAGGGSKQPKPPYEAPDSLRSVQYADIVDLVGEGEFEGWDDPAHPLRCIFLNETPVENADGTINYENFNVQTRLGTQTQEPFNDFDAVQSELQVNFELKNGIPWTRAITNRNLTRLRVTLGVPVLFTTKDNGDTVGGLITYAIDLAVDGGAFETVLEGAIDGKTTNEYKRKHVIQLPKSHSTGWTLRVRKTSADPTDSRVQATFYVNAYTEIVDVRMRMPMSAVHKLRFAAEQFPTIPSRAYFMKGLRVQVPSNYDPVARTYTGIWDGTFKIAWTDNPAWHLYAMALNDRFGLGHLITPALIDKWLLYGIAQYCDELVPDGFGGTEPRFTCNMYIQTPDDALRVMMSIASVFRGILYNAHNLIMSVQDRPQATDDWIYTPANVIGGKFTYAGSGRKARHTVALVSWNDPSDFYRAKVQYVEDEEGIARYGYRPTEIIAVGATSQGQATRAGNHALITNRVETDTVTFMVGLDGVIPQPGRVIAIQDPLRARARHSGRTVADGTTESVVVDLVPATVAIGDLITVHLPTGAAQRRTISAINDNTISVSVPFEAAPSKHAVWMVETAAVKAQRFRVLSVTESTDPLQIGYQVVGLQHVAEKYQLIENGIKFDEPPITLGFSKLQYPVSSVFVGQRDVFEQNTTQTIVTVSWDAAQKASGYAVSWRYDNGEWTVLPETNSTSVDIAGVVPGVFEAKVEAFNASGGRSAPTFSLPYTIAPNATPPGYVAEIEQSIATTAADAAADATAKADAARVAAMARADEALARADVAMARLADISNADDWVLANTYPSGDMVKHGGSLWRALQDVPANTDINNAAYWQNIGTYSSIGEALASSISIGNANTTELESQASTLSGVTARMPTGTDKLANEARVVAAENAAATATGAVASTLSGVTARMPTGADKLANEARVVAAEDASVGRDNALGSRVATVEARMPAGSGGLATSAQVADEATARASADSALGTRTGVIEARMPTGNDKLANEARVVTAETASADRDSVLAGRATALEAKVNDPVTGLAQTASVVQSMSVEVRNLKDRNPNLLINGGFDYGVGNWSFTSGFGWSSAWYGKTLVASPSVGTTTAAQDVKVASSATYTISGEVGRDNGAGDVYLTGYWVDAADGFIAWAPSLPFFVADNWQRKSLTIESPANAAKFRFVVWVNATTAAAYFRKLKFAIGTDTVFSDETTAKAQYVLAVNANGKIAGIKLASDGTTSDAEFLADNFKLITSDGYGLALDKTKMDRKFTGVAIYEGNAFGSDYLAFWIGPNTIAKAGATKANAAFWVDYTGANGGGAAITGSGSYFQKETAANNTLTATTVSFPRSTARAAREITAVLSMSVQSTKYSNDGTGTSAFSTPFVVEVSRDGGAWTQIDSQGMCNGTITRDNSEPGITYYEANGRGSIVAYDTGGGTNLQYRARETGSMPSVGASAIPNRTISIKVTEI